MEFSGHSVQSASLAMASAVADGFDTRFFSTKKIIPPPPTLPNTYGVPQENLKFTRFEQQDSVLVSWLLFSVSTTILPHLIDMDKSAQIWNTIASLYGSKTTFRLMFFRRALRFQQKGDLFMKDFLIKIKGFCDNLASCGEVISERKHVTAILNGLPPKYDSVITIITLSHTTYTVQGPPASAINSDSPPAYYPITAPRGRGRGRSSGSRIQCQLNEKMGHLVDRCYHRFDSSYKSTDYRPPPSSQVNVCTFGQGASILPWMASSLNTFLPVAPYLQPGWFIPPTSTLSWTANASQSANAIGESSTYNGPGKVYIGNGTALPVHSTSQSSLLTRTRPPYMRSLLHVPGITKNLLSVSQFTKDNHVMFEFLPTQCLRDLHTRERVLLCPSVSGTLGLDILVKKEIYHFLILLLSMPLHYVWWLLMFGVWHQYLQMVFGIMWLSSMPARDIPGFTSCAKGLRFQPFFLSFIEWQRAQNGIVKHKHRQIVEVGLSMLAHASMPLSYWNDAFASDIYLINRLPSSPLGYPSLHKGYRCLAPDGKIYVSRHMTFHETTFPFQTLCPTPKSTTFRSVSSKLLVLSLSIRPAMPSQSVPINSSPDHPTSLKPMFHSSSPIIFSSLSSFYVLILSNSSSSTPSLPLNSHPMITRGKASIFKPKSLCPLSSHRRAIGCKWLFKVKRKADGTVDRYKARLVAKGFSQYAGLDFRDTFSPLIEDIYMEQQPGFEVIGAAGQPLVYPSLFVRTSSSDCLFLMVYVDDIVIIDNSSTAIDTVVKQLHHRFVLKDMGRLNFFLGIDVHHNAQRIFLRQRKYVLEILKKADMLGAVVTPTPMVSMPTLVTSDGSSPLVDAHLYRSVVGILQYLCITRPDLSFCVNKLSQFMNSPSELHWKAVKRVLRYLVGTMEHGLSFSKGQFQLECYCNVDCASSLEDRRSTTGYVVYLGPNPVAWYSKKQVVVSRSSSEAEYRSLANCVSELLWVRQLLEELGIQKKVLDGSLQVNFVPSANQIADVLTKLITSKHFAEFQNALKVLSSSDKVVNLEENGENVRVMNKGG
ncbi:hypothetical protein CXB51_031133 [Gossypium anomalum]|uniref:Reverse transcriptase Ty1/copia-type domain-containing protein n=1 Tax=Gossypium anomalum TaxID=47600 RepID=A0A8J5Y4E2_9ROSI|nr:hypothetical protein CXB51_031133 [Gossypium anomalum]